MVSTEEKTSASGSTRGGALVSMMICPTKVGIFFALNVAGKKGSQKKKGPPRAIFNKSLPRRATNQGIKSAFMERGE